MKKRVYIETTVVSYFTALQSRDLVIAGHQQITQEWWNNYLINFKPFISEVVHEEISRGDKRAAAKRRKAVKDFSFLEVNNEVLALAKDYYSVLNLPEKARFDAVHLALGVWHGMDFIVSWNFAHISGARPRQIIETINYNKGIQTPVICTPEELME